MLSADGAPADIVSYVCVYAKPIHCLSHLCLHPIDPLMCSILVCKGVTKQFQGNADPGPLEEKARFKRQFVPDSPEMSGNLGNLLSVPGPISKDQVIDDAIHWVTFHRTLNDVQFSIK